MRKLRIGLLALITAGLLAGCGAMPASAPPVGSTTSVPVQTVVHSTPLSLQRFLSIPNKSVLITGYSITEAPPKSVVVVTRLQAQADYYRQFPSRVAPRILGIFLARVTFVRHTTATYPPAPNAILCWAVVISAKVEKTFKDVGSFPGGTPWTAILLSAVSGTSVTGFTGVSKVR